MSKATAGSPVVVVTPEFGGLRVAEVKDSDRFSVGDVIGWADIGLRRDQRGMLTWVTPDGQEDHAVSVRGGLRGARLASRMKERVSKRDGACPVFEYEPKRESVRAYWVFMNIFGGALACAAGYFFLLSFKQPIGGPWNGWQLAVIVAISPLAWMCIGTIWLFYRARPRNPQYDRVAVTEVGFLLESDGAESIDITWADVDGYKRIGGDPARLRLDLSDGRRIWLAIPGWVRSEVLTRVPVELGGVRADQSALMRSTIWLSIRLMVTGVIGATLYGALLVWLRNAGHLLPADFGRILGPGVVLFVFSTWFPATMMLGTIWRRTPRGRRAVRRWSRRLGQRLGSTNQPKPQGG